MATELPSTFEIPYVPFDEKNPIISIGGFSVRRYIAPSEMRGYIEYLSQKVDLFNYKYVVVNLKGGRFLFRWLSLLQGYKYKPVEVEYHRPKDGYGAIVKRPVPNELQNTKSLVIDDIYDSGGVMSAIMSKVGAGSQAVALVTKNGIPHQIEIPNILIGLKIDNKWLGGCGMDLGLKGEKDTFRNYPGLVVKISE